MLLGRGEGREGERVCMCAQMRVYSICEFNTLTVMWKNLKPG